MKRNTFENTRKDWHTVTIHAVKTWDALYKLYSYYIEASGFRRIATTTYGFTATHGSMKVIAYIKEGKKE